MVLTLMHNKWVDTFTLEEEHVEEEAGKEVGKAPTPLSSSIPL